MTPEEEGRRLLLQDCEGLGIRWDALQLTGCDLPKGGQGSTLKTNGRSSNALGDLASDGETLGDPSQHSSQAQT